MIEKFISVIASPIPYVLLISLVITVHELGHYWVGRFFGAAVESFSLGFGKSIAETTDSRGTRWRLNWLPIGGFVKFVGEMQLPQDGNAESAPALKGVPYDALGPWKRLGVSLGGPFANFIFAVIVFAGLAMSLGVPQSSAVQVVEVEVGTPAERAGFRPGDIVIRAGDRNIEMPADVQRATMLNSGEEVKYVVERDGARVELVAIPEEVRQRNEALKVTTNLGRVGLHLTSIDMEIRRLNPIEATGYGVKSLGDAISDTMTVLRRLVTSFTDIDKLSGPLGILNITDNVTDYQMQQTDVSYGERLGRVGLSLLELAALLSIGVGIFNLLPIPVLDGGAALLCIAEGVTGRAVPESLQRLSLTIGLACLVSFALVVTWFDIARWLAA